MKILTGQNRYNIIMRNDNEHIKKYRASSGYPPWEAPADVIQMTFDLSVIFLNIGKEKVSIVAGRSADEIRLMYEQYSNGGIQALNSFLGINVIK